MPDVNHTPSQEVAVYPLRIDDTVANQKPEVNEIHCSPIRLLILSAHWESSVYFIQACLKKKKCCWKD